MRRELTQNEKMAAGTLKDTFEYQKRNGLWKNQDELSEKMGFSTQAAVNHYLNGRRPISFEVGVRFCRLLKLDPAMVNPDWAEMLEVRKRKSLTIEQISEKLSVERDEQLFEVEEPKAIYSAKEISEFVDVPYYNFVEISLGNGTVVHSEDEETKSLSFQQKWLDEMDLDVRHLVVVKCKGNSMEPRIHDKDVVLINKNIEAIEDSSIYAINYSGEAKLKRLIKRADGSLIIRSDNQSGMYPDEVVDPEMADQLKIIGKAVWVGGML